MTTTEQRHLRPIIQPKKKEDEEFNSQKTKKHSCQSFESVPMGHCQPFLISIRPFLILSSYIYY